jgi:hypothetical protein
MVIVIYNNIISYNTSNNIDTINNNIDNNINKHTKYDRNK